MQLKPNLNLNPFNPKYLEWFNLFLDPEHTIQFYRGERVKSLKNLQIIDVQPLNKY